MKVTVVGTGNVGAALLFPLAFNPAIDRVGVISRAKESADAAILDVASACADAASKLAFETADQIADSDVVVITSGVSQKGKSADESYAPNLQIAESTTMIGRQGAKRVLPLVLPERAKQSVDELLELRRQRVFQQIK